MAKTDVNPFWDFSLRHYGDSEVASLCLHWQEKWGADVNILSYALWLAQIGRELDTAAIESHGINHWQQSVVHPIRVARNALKPGNTGNDRLGMLYRSLKQSELEAEQIEQDRLYRLASHMPQPALTSDTLQLAQRNLRYYLTFLQIEEAESHPSARTISTARFRTIDAS